MTRESLDDQGWLPGSAGLNETPQQDRSRRTIKLVIDAAEQLVGEIGAEGLTMAAISERSGVSIGGIYGRFDGKLGVLKAVRDRALRSLEVDLAARYEIAPSTLEEAVSIFVTTLAPTPRRRLFSVSPDTSWDQRDLLALERLRFLFGDAVEGLLPQGRIRHSAVATDVAFHLVLSALSWYDVPPESKASPPTLETTTDEVVRAVVAYLRLPH